MNRRKLQLALLLMTITSLSACSMNRLGGATGSAVAELKPTRGNTASGQIRFEQIGSRVLVSGSVVGLKPLTEHGFHVHEKGDCTSGDGMSTGGHFNPEGKSHGAHGQGLHHVGDMPNLKADAAGVATFRFESNLMSLGDGQNSIVGRGLIVHRDPDDYRSQPAGNAGPRIACAVITRS